MPRDSHSIFRFKGVSYTDSVANIPPDAAIDSLNVFGDPGGYLTQFQQPTELSFLAAANFQSIFLLPDPSVLASNPRLLAQYGGSSVSYIDFPYTNPPTLLTHGLLSGLAARLDYALCNGIAYLSNAQDTGYVRPGVPTRYKWGILPPATPPILIKASTAWVPGSITIQRVTGVTTVTFSNPHGALALDPAYIDYDPSATWDSSFYGLYPIASVPNPHTITINQPALPDAGPFVRAVYPSGISATNGFQYGFCFGAAGVAHWSSLSPYGVSTGPFANQSPTIMLPSPATFPFTDWQIDSYALFRDQDGVVPGGGLWYLVSNTPDYNFPNFPGYQAVFVDTTSDESLTTSGQTAPYDNGVAPLGKYLAVWLDRVLMCGIPSDPTGVRFTGYDSINFGRPQMSWCQFNEIKLGQGQATPNGMGLLRYGGMVFFATDGLMYIYRGTLNDITVSAPTSLSFYAEQLPYNIGCYSHFSIQSTPSGLVWLDDGFNLRVMDNTGFYPPKLVAPQLSALFKRITPGAADRISSVHINYLQRDWYILSFPVDGAFANNMTVVVDVSTAGSTGAWPVNHSIAGMVWAEYADSTGHLIAIQPSLTSQSSGVSFLTEIPILNPIVQGIVDPNQMQLHPPNAPMPGGFWRGGYFGIRDEAGEDEFSDYKMFRYARIGSSLASGLNVQAYIVNGEEWTWDNPAVIPFDTDGDISSINTKGRALSPVLIFPDDAIISVNSLMLAWVALGPR